MRSTALFAILALGCTEPATPTVTQAPLPPEPVSEAQLPMGWRTANVPIPPAFVRISITPDTVILDSAPLWAAVPASAREPIRPVPTAAIPLTQYAFAGTAMTPLIKHLTALKFPQGMQPTVVLRAASGTPYAVIADVLAAARAAHYRLRVRTRTKTGLGLLPMEEARACTEPVKADAQCTTTWALLTDDRIVLQNRPLGEAGCAQPLAQGSPKSTLKPINRGQCAHLRHQNNRLLSGIIPPHRQRHIKGARCNMATFVGWPSVPWSQVVDTVDALRKAGHPRIAMSIDRARGKCPEVPKALAPVAPKSP